MGGQVWRHLLYAYDSETAGVKFYLDGRLVLDTATYKASERLAEAERVVAVLKASSVAQLFSNATINPHSWDVWTPSLPHNLLPTSSSPSPSSVSSALPRIFLPLHAPSHHHHLPIATVPFVLPLEPLSPCAPEKPDRRRRQPQGKAEFEGIPGKMAQLRVYPRALSAAEVDELHEKSEWPWRGGFAPRYLVRQCSSATDADYADSNDQDANLHSCSWFAAQVKESPFVCSPAWAKDMCPVTCAGRCCPLPNYPHPHRAPNPFAASPTGWVAGC